MSKYLTDAAAVLAILLLFVAVVVAVLGEYGEATYYLVLAVFNWITFWGLTREDERQ